MGKKRENLGWWTVTFPDGEQLAVYLGAENMADEERAGERPIEGFAAAVHLGPDLCLTFIMSAPHVTKAIGRELCIWGEQIQSDIGRAMIEARRGPRPVP